MKHAVRLLSAVLVAVFGWLAAPTATATASSGHPVVVYTYDTPAYDAPTAHTALERGPPAHSTGYTLFGAVDRWSDSTSARPDGLTAALSTTDDYTATLAQVVSTSGTTQVPAQVADERLAASGRAGVAAKTAQAGSTLEPESQRVRPLGR